MSRIRIAQRAWEGAAGVERVSARTCGLDLMWVEIDGVRITDVIAAEVAFAKNADSVPSITVQPFGTVEVVYLNPRGEEIDSVHVDPRVLDELRYEHGATHRRPPPVDVDRAIRERDRALARVAELEAQLQMFMAGSRGYTS